VPDLVTRVTRRLRGAAGSRRDRYAAFIAGVEPALTAGPRVHRFAAVPLVGDPRTAPAPVAVCVDPAQGGDAAATRASLEAQTVGPAAVLERDPAAGAAETTAPWVAVVAAGDQLAPAAVERLGQGAALAPGAALITCDDDVLDRAGRRVDPRCRPGPSPDLLAARDVSGALLCVPREQLARTDTAQPSWGHRLAVRLAGPAGAGHAHLPQILCHAARRRAPGPPAPPQEAPRGEPSVEAIVCFRDRPDLLEGCAGSLLERSGYERLVLRLVDNGSAEPQTARLLDRLRRHPRVSVERDERPFNFSVLNNAAAARSSADVLAFVNNDVEAQEPGWLAPLLAQAVRDEVGAVGPLLTYEDGRVQHAGAAIGIHGWAGHPFAGLRPGAVTPFGSATDGPRNWLAVTAACMLVERRKFEAVGGFDERFTVTGNDVDLCLRLTAAGHRSLCLPSVSLVHHEYSSREPLDIPDGDFVRSRQAYGAFRTVGDPFYNPNLTLADTSCAMRTPGELPE
jgi:GT2 family glycosyltransferase